MIQVSVELTPTHTRQLYQVKHDAVPWRQSPEVFPLQPKHPTDMTEAWQWWMFEKIVQSVGNTMTLDECQIAFKKIYDYHLAFTNFHGFENDADPRADFINRENLTAPLPKFWSLICGGDVLAGTENGDDLDVETLHGNDPPPKGVSRKTHPWLVQLATNANDKTHQVTRFTQLRGSDVPVPVLARFPVKFPLSQLIKLPIGSPVPSPYNF